MKKIEFNADDNRKAAAFPSIGAWGAIERAGFQVGSNGWSSIKIGYLHYKLGFEIAVVTLAELGLDQVKPHEIREKVVEMGWELYVPASASGNSKPELQEILEAQDNTCSLREPVGWISISVVHPTGCGRTWSKDKAFVVFRPEVKTYARETKGSEVVTV